jgi:hypothetical protein
MKLFESPDFYDAIVAATAHFQGAGLTEQLIEKDYYVTEALRVIATFALAASECLNCDCLPAVRFASLVFLLLSDLGSLMVSKAKSWV